MKQEDAKILSNVEIAKDIWKMELQTSLAKEAKPGQFIEIEVPPFFLRRPISINEIKEDSLVIIYKILGEGTLKMTTMKETLNIFGPCGNGFPIKDSDVVLVGGGVGVPPLYETAKQYRNRGYKVDVVLGFNDESQIFFEEEFKILGCNVLVATMDGSKGTKGTVLDAIQQAQITNDFVLACGPLPMLKALQKQYTKGYLSLEARMACGIGACMGCVVQDTQGHALRVCKDGPVFPIQEVVL